MIMLLVINGSMNLPSTCLLAREGEGCDGGAGAGLLTAAQLLLISLATYAVIECGVYFQCDFRQVLEILKKKNLEN